MTAVGEGPSSAAAPRVGGWLQTAGGVLALALVAGLAFAAGGVRERSRQAPLSTSASASPSAPPLASGSIDRATFRRIKLTETMLSSACITFTLDNAAQPPFKRALLARCELGPTLLKESERMAWLPLMAGLGEPEHQFVDAWGRRYVYECTSEIVKVTSPGPDAVFGTDDDVERDCLRDKPP